MTNIRTIVNTKTLTILFSLAAFAGAMRYILTPWTVYVYCDQRLHPSVQKTIKSLIEKTPVRTVGVEALCAELQKEFPVVQGLSIAYKGSLAAHVSVKAHVPWVCLTSVQQGQAEQTVCKSGLLVEKRYFNELVTQGMPQLIIEGKEFKEIITDPIFMKCVLNLSREILADYAIIWRSKVEIFLRARALPIIFIADVATINERERFVYVDRIFNSDQDRYKNGMKADIRLRDEIICSPLEEKN